MLKVSKYFIKYLINKYANNVPFDSNELDQFWCKTKSKFIVCDNTQGMCVVEEFKSLESVYDYFSLHKPAEDNGNDDKELTH